jgi:hypothetical protein
MKPVAAAFGDDGGNSGDVALSSCCHSIYGLLLLHGASAAAASAAEATESPPLSLLRAAMSCDPVDLSLLYAAALLKILSCAVCCLGSSGARLYGARGVS